jgi:Flp pilus assembly pilin Flp
MNKYEIGQGVVDYNLILVLVAVVVISLMAVVGPELQKIFADVLCASGLEDYCSWSIP